MLGGNEMGPRTNGEYVIIWIILVTLVIINAIIFGQITVLIELGSQKSSFFQKQVDMANTVMKNIALPVKTQSEIRVFILQTQGTQYE